MARPTPLDRFWAKVDKTGDCWLWTNRIDRYGYGKFTLLGRDLIAHRWGYMELVGPIPEGLTLDHLCHTRVAEECAALPGICLHRRCVNPDHLEPVTQLENKRRGSRVYQGSRRPLSRCRRGLHDWTPENTLIDADGQRRCRDCRRESARQFALRQKAA